MTKKFMYLVVVLAILCGGVVLTCCNNDDNVVPTEDSSQFVTLTDVVPDAILEIRYYGTYNFVGQRIDGYLDPTTAHQAGCSSPESCER